MAGRGGGVSRFIPNKYFVALDGTLKEVLV